MQVGIRAGRTAGEWERTDSRFVSSLSLSGARGRGEGDAGCFGGPQAGAARVRQEGHQRQAGYALPGQDGPGVPHRGQGGQC